MLPTSICIDKMKMLCAYITQLLSLYLPNLSTILPYLKYIYHPSIHFISMDIYQSYLQNKNTIICREQFFRYENELFQMIIYNIDG